MTTDRLVKRMTAGALVAGSLAFAAFSLSAGTAQAFDPQPEPPGITADSHVQSPGIRVGFNPQPEPPTRRLPGVSMAGI